MRKGSHGRLGSSKKEEAPLLHSLIRESGTLKEVEELLKEDASMIHDRDRLGGTPLHAAVEAGKAEIVQYLLVKSGINVNLIDRHGWTPLHTACHRGDLAVIELLLTGGAGGLGTNNPSIGVKPKGFGGSNGFDSRSPSNFVSVTLTTVDLSTPLHYFVRHPPPDQAPGIKVGMRTSSETYYSLPMSHTPPAISKGFLLRETGEATRKWRSDGSRPYAMPAHDKYFIILQYLLGPKQGPLNTSNAMNKNGETPTHLLASARTSSPLVLAYLLQHDANVNITNRYGETPLHLAVRNGRAELVEMLLEHGADMTVVGGEGTPRDVALRAKLPEMMALLDKEEKRRLKALKKKKKKSKGKKKKKGSSEEVHSSDAGERLNPFASGKESGGSLSSTTSGLKGSAEQKMDEEGDLSVNDKERMIELLNSLKLTKYIPLFVDEDIGMRALMLLTDDDLKSLGVKMGGRRVILDYTQKEREREEKERETGERRRGGSANGSPNTHARKNSGGIKVERLSTSARNLGPLVSKRRGRDAPQRKSVDSGPATSESIALMAKSTSGLPTDDDDTGGEDCNFEEVDAPEEREEDEAELSDSSGVEMKATIAVDSLSLDEHLGTGAFGDVYKGRLRGMTIVAVKKLTGVNQTAFLREAKIMQQIPNHPNVVTFYGMAASQNVLYIVTEFVPHGSLALYLRSNINKVPMHVLVQMAKDIVSGMEHLRANDVVHRDLAARNLLLEIRSNGEHRVKVSDFGLSRPLMESEYYKTGDSSRGHIPVKWTAPEALKWLKYSSQSDVWAFGVVLWEIFSYGQAPYPGLSNSEVIQEVSKGYRMPPPDNCPGQIVELMNECWHDDPLKRPQWINIFVKLSALEEKLLDEWEEKERRREKDDREKQKDMADLKRRLELQEEIERELENAARNYSSQHECIAQIERILDELDRKVDESTSRSVSPLSSPFSSVQGNSSSSSLPSS